MDSSDCLGDSTEGSDAEGEVLQSQNTRSHNQEIRSEQYIDE